jgi:hypothetical protein
VNLLTPNSGITDSVIKLLLNYMAGEGRTGKVGKRHQSNKSSGPSTLTRNDIRRLARRGGVKRISA